MYHYLNRDSDVNINNFLNPFRQSGFCSQARRSWNLEKEGRGTKEGEKDPEWGDSKSMLSISQLSHDSHGHLKAGWEEAVMCTVWLPLGNWAKQTRKGLGIEQARERLPKSERICNWEEGETVLFTIWAGLNTKKFHFHEKQKIQSLVSEHHARLTNPFL